MNEFLWQTYHRLIADIKITTHRFLYDQLDLEHRLTGIVGPRGVGKTTMLLQYIKEHLYDAGQCFYFSADSSYFNTVSLVAFVDELYQQQNIRIFVIDEIHKYANWNQELKNIYDAFPQVRLIFSGSSSIDLITGAYDLSRRAKLLQLPGLSFREYLNIVTQSSFAAITLDHLLENHQKIAADLSKVAALQQHFEDYKLLGYYPIVFENRNNLYHALANTLDKTIYEDIANFYNLKTVNLTHFKRIISFLATIPPGAVKSNRLANSLAIDNKTVNNYLDILQRTSLIKMLYPMAHGHQTLTKAEKIYLDNSTLLASTNTILSQQLDIGTLREIVFMQSVAGAKLTVYYPSQGDFQINDIVFEVGGKNKKWQQLQSYQGPKYLIKDNILVGMANEIPLYLLGFLY